MRLGAGNEAAGGSVANESKAAGVDTASKEYLTVAQFADEIGVSENTVRQWIRSGFLTVEEVRGRWLIVREGKAKPKGQTMPEITGPPEFRRRVRQALDLLRRKDPKGCRLVVENVTLIREEELWNNGAAYEQTTGNVVIDPDVMQGSLMGIAGVLVHEAVHAVAGLAERPSYQRQKITLARLGVSKREIDRVDEALRRTYGKNLPPE